MTGELDALLIRSLPELNDAANRLDMLSREIGHAVDEEIAAWISRDDWQEAPMSAPAAQFGSRRPNG